MAVHLGTEAATGVGGVLGLWGQVSWGEVLGPGFPPPPGGPVPGSWGRLEVGEGVACCPPSLPLGAELSAAAEWGSCVRWWVFWGRLPVWVGSDAWAARPAAEAVGA